VAVTGADVALTCAVDDAVDVATEVFVAVAGVFVAVALALTLALAFGELDGAAGAPGTVTLPFTAATLESVPAAPPLLPANCWTLTRTVLDPPATPCHETAKRGQLDPLPQPVPSWKPATRTVPPALSIGDATGSAVQPWLNVTDAAVTTAGSNASVTSKPLTESLLAMEAMTLVLAF